LGRVGRLRKDLVIQNPRLRLHAVCDLNPQPMEDLKDCLFFNNYNDLLDSDIDAVFVATPNKFSPEIVIAALNHNKHVFCEKPPGRNVEDIKNIISAENKHGGLILKFGLNHRYHCSVMEAKKIIDSGKYGKILWVRGIYGKSGGINFEKEWRSHREIAGGGILLDQGIHMLDLFRFFLGDFQEIKSFVTTSYWNIDQEDNAFALMRTPANQIAFLHSSSTQWKHTFLLEIFLEEGYVILQGILSSTRSYGQGERLIVAKKQFENETFAVGNPQESVTYFDQDKSWGYEVEEFVDCIVNKNPVKNGNSNDALQVMRLVYSIYNNYHHIKKTS
jgi:predicted dehydrogenase